MTIPRASPPSAADDAEPPAAPPYRTATPVLRTTRATQVGPGVLEASATLEADGRVHAIAFRLEDRGDGVWRCTALELAP